MSNEHIEEAEVIEEVVADEAQPKEFKKEDAVEESKNFLADLLLKDPNTQNEMFVATNVQMNEDGSVSVICVEDVDSEQAVMHTIFSGYVQKSTGEEETATESDIIVPEASGKILGLDGQPLT